MRCHRYIGGWWSRQATDFRWSIDSFVSDGGEDGRMRGSCNRN
jgi:hypothetical protein